jgi:hypothetical protein
MKLATIAVLVALADVARADSPFAVLTTKGQSWTYDVVRSRSHKPTGGHVTLTVREVEHYGAFTVTVLDDGPEHTHWFRLVIGPDGLRATMADDDPTEASCRTMFDSAYLPTIFFPAVLAAHHKSMELDRFGADDRMYKVAYTIAQRPDHAWRVTWKGTYVVPEEGGPSGNPGDHRYAASFDLDPARGLTMLCPDSEGCLRLAAAAPGAPQ